jgi:hypothetical protein
MSGMARRDMPARGPRGGRPRDKDPKWRRQNHRPGYNDETTRPVNRRVQRTNECEEDE